jgi:CRP-like cAMP-binding protein
MSALTNLPRNRLLLALPSSNLKQLMPELEPIRCDREQILMDVDSSLEHVFFPDSGVVSAVAVYSDGRIIETATIGREGCTNVQAALGAKRSSVRLLIQIPGSAQKMPRETFVRAMSTMPPFRTLMYAYLQAFLEQILVSVACNGAHSLRERLARWLLMMRDRSDDDSLRITQGLLAEMLGVQRPTITVWRTPWQQRDPLLSAHLDAGTPQAPTRVVGVICLRRDRRQRGRAPQGRAVIPAASSPRIWKPRAVGDRRGASALEATIAMRHDDAISHKWEGDREHGHRCWKRP